MLELIRLPLKKNTLLRLILSVGLCLICVSPLLAIEKPGEDLKEVGLLTNPGDQIDPELSFQDSFGNEVTLNDYLGSGHPLIVVPSFYNCPRLCGLVLNGLTELLNKLDLEMGQDYQVVVVSFDSTETPEHATKIREKYLSMFNGKGDPATGWHYLVGNEDSVSQLMGQLGFKYVPDGDDFAHAAAIMLLTPEGKISQYFTGISFPDWDVRLALVEASKGAIGSALDQVMLFCFRFDPTKGRYTWFAMNVMRAGGSLTLLLLGGLMFILWRRERKQKVSNSKEV